jgi:glycerol-3-phosphate dehydrogenase
MKKGYGDLPKKIAYLGSGIFGQAMAYTLAHHNRKGNPIEHCLWNRSSETIQQLIESLKKPNYTNEKVYLDPKKLPKDSFRFYSGYTGSQSLGDCIDGAELIIIGVSSAGILEISKKLAKKNIPKNVLILSLSKGIIEHKKRLYLPSEAMELYLPDNPIAALSGLTFAEEIFEKADTFANVALNYADTITKRIDRKKMYERLKRIFNIGHLTTFRYDNILWVETGGAAKNVYGIASGYTNRMLQLRHNRSGSHDENLYLNTLLSLAMYTGIEMRVIYNTLRKKDRNPRDYLFRTHVFTNQNIPAWDGDRYGTLLGRKSRNFRYGELKAEGRSDKDPEIKKLGTIEGINTTKQLTNLFDEEEKKVQVPLLAGVNEWLVGKAKVEEVVKDLIEYLRSVDGRKGSKKSVSKIIKKKKQASELKSSDSI